MGFPKPCVFCLTFDIWYFCLTSEDFFLKCWVFLMSFEYLFEVSKSKAWKISNKTNQAQKNECGQTKRHGMCVDSQTSSPELWASIWQSMKTFLLWRGLGWKPWPCKFQPPQVKACWSSAPCWRSFPDGSSRNTFPHYCPPEESSCHGGQTWNRLNFLCMDFIPWILSSLIKVIPWIYSFKVIQ